MGFLDTIGAWIGKNTVRWLRGIGRQVLTGVMSMGAMWSFHGLVHMAPNQALWVAKQITKAYYTLPVEWAGFIGEYLERMTGEKITLTNLQGNPLAGGSKDAMVALGKTFLDPMLGLIMPTKEEADKEPMRGAESFMSANLQFQMSAWLLHLLGDTMSFGMFKSLKDLPNAISWSYGIGWLSWMVMGPIFRAGITAPMEKKFAEFYRYTPLTNAQIIDAYYAGLKSAEEMHQELAETGLEDKDIEIMVKLSRKRFSESQLEYMVRRGFRDRDQVIQYYKDMSFPQEDAEAMAERLLTKSARDYTEKIAKRIEDLYKAGVVSEEELRRYFTDTNLTLEEQDLAITALDLETAGTAKLSDSEIARLYQQGKMSYDEALKRLQVRYADPLDAQQLLELYPPKAEREAVIKPRELSPSEIGRLYRLGAIDRGEALSKLMTRVPPVAEAELFLVLYEREETMEVEELLKGLTPAQVGRLYQRGIIDMEEAMARLIVMNYPEDEAYLFLALYPLPAV